MGFVWPRPDFNGAAHELLIGLLSTATAPEDDEAWDDWWYSPPAPDVLEQRLSSFAHAFDLDGPGPRFLQDLDPLDDADSKPVAALLIDTPGVQTLRNNADLFVKRGVAHRYSAVPPPPWRFSHCTLLCPVRRRRASDVPSRRRAR